MPDFNKWSSSAIEAMDAAQFAASTWALIQRKSTVLVIRRKQAALAAQTVRVEYSNTEREFDAATDSTGSRRDVQIFGVRGHSDIANSDLQRGDQFGFDGRLFRITDVIVGVGKIEAHAEALA